jgi:septal ring factor EnvC (AmiA/AmiB activator)
MTGKFYISGIFNVILLSGIIYLFFFNENPTIDIKQYTDKIDSLNRIVVENNKKLDSLSNLESKQENNIKNLKEQLKTTSNKNKNLKKKYEDEITRYNNMSDNDITTLFTENFK